MGRVELKMLRLSVAGERGREGGSSCSYQRHLRYLGAHNAFSPMHDIHDSCLSYPPFLFSLL